MNNNSILEDDDLENNITTSLFNLDKDKLEDITISQTWKGDNCIIHKNNSKTIIFKGFIIKEKEKTLRTCEVSFYESSLSGKYVPRLVFKILNKDGSVKNTNKDQRIAFEKEEEGRDNFWLMLSFLISFKDLVDTGEFNNKYKVIETKAYAEFLKTKESNDKIKDLETIFKDSGTTIDEVISGLKSAKKEILKEFEKMLKDNTKKEDDWKKFFMKNKWILGLNVDVRFISDFYDEANVGIQNTASTGSPRVDMLGVSDYTSLIELKTPLTKIFTDNKKSTARTNTWSFSDDFIDGISQCLAQKSDADRNIINKDIVNEKNEVLDQNIKRTRDIKSILIIGNKSQEFPEDSKDKNILIKRDSFELFRRNSRNIEIMTYDELYERTKKIVDL